jgi:hypothetical protein
MLLFIVPAPGPKSSWSSLFERFTQLQLKNRHRQIADPAAPELTCSRIKNRRCRGVLGHCFHARPRVSRDAKRALRPSENPVRLTFGAPEKHIGLFSLAKRRHSLDSRMQVANTPAQSPYRDQTRKQPLILLKDFETRLCPDFAVFPTGFPRRGTAASPRPSLASRGPRTAGARAWSRSPPRRAIPAPPKIKSTEIAAVAKSSFHCTSKAPLVAVLSRLVF